MNEADIRSAVKAKRKAKGFTQAALGILAGLAPSTVSLIERTGRISRKSAVALAIVLDCTPEELGA